MIPVIRILAVAAALVALGCSSTRVLQPEAPPPRAERARPADGATARRPTDQAATERFLDSEIARRAPQGDGQRAPSGRGGARSTTDEAATELFLDHEIERRRYVPPAPPTPQVVERIYVDQPADAYGRHYRAEHDYYASRFPWSTAVGAGLGAVIGHQSGHRGQGAAIGAGAGLLFDMMRWR